MKTITLHDPWATLVILGEKKFETRSWPTQHRGLLGIHAGKNTQWLHLMHEEPFRSVLQKHGITHPGQFKLGHMLGEVMLMECTKIIEPMQLDAAAPNEIAFGDWRTGRFAWELEVLKKYEQPFYTRGYQQLWNYEESK